MSSNDLFCWTCEKRQPVTEIEPNIFRCQVCQRIRDLTDPDESLGKLGE
jgi:hypothetical protein